MRKIVSKSKGQKKHIATQSTKMIEVNCAWCGGAMFASALKGIPILINPDTMHVHDHKKCYDEVAEKKKTGL